jgi:hypothetical protein
MENLLKIIAFCLLAATSAATSQPLLNPEQIKYVQNMQVAAAAASKQAEKELLEIFGSAKFRMGLLWNGVGSRASWKLALTPATELLEQLKSALEFTEYTSNFGVDAEWEKEHPGQANMGFDDFEEYGYIPNMWELRAAKNFKAPRAQWDIMEAAETGLYRAPISGALMPVGPNASEAKDRVQYLAGNLRRVDIGIARYGAFAALIRNNVIRDRAALLPTDSGGWENACNSSVKPIAWWYPVVGDAVLRCKAMYHPKNSGHPIPGTTGNQLHTILANTIGVGMDGGALSRLVFQMLSPTATTRRFETLFYTEAGVLGTVRIQDIKLVVASFPGVFGTEQATRVRDFCTKHRIPFAWALNTGETWSESRSKPQEWIPFAPSAEPVGADRLIDPITYSLTNATVEFPPSWKMIWKSVTAEVEARRLAAGKIEVSDYQKWWDRITAFGGALHTMRAGDCHSNDLCSGTYTAAGGQADCLCMDSDELPMHGNAAVEAASDDHEGAGARSPDVAVERNNMKVTIV